MSNGNSFTCIVDVLWQAVPESIGFYQMSNVDQNAASQKLVNQINLLVPEEAQAKWQNLVITAADYDDVAAKVHAILKAEVSVPAGTELELPISAIQWVPMPPSGHAILYCAMLKDTAQGTIQNWTISASQGGMTYMARVGLRFEVLTARVP